MHVMHRYQLIIAYDGTGYCGWQVQKDKPTIAQTLQDTFAHIFSTPITIIGVSRTDAGVHAQGQIATFTTNRIIADPDKIKYAWNNLLPGSILIKQLEMVPLTYNQFNNIAHKAYWYHLFLQKPSPLVSRYGWHVRSGISMEKLHQALQVFVGTHDYRLFVTDDDREDDTIRTIDRIDIVYDHEKNAYKIIVIGPKFLRHMIRRIIGASVEVALRADLSVDCLTMMLTHHTITRTLVSAPAHGLMLHSIVYKS